MQELFRDETVEPSKVEVLARGFKAEANAGFKQMVAKIYDDVERFWYRNKTEGGQLVAESGDEPTGLEILVGLGTDALPVLSVAFARVRMLQGIVKSMGLPEDTLDQTKMLPPYDLVWNKNGSVDADKSTLADWYVSPVKEESA